MDTKQIEYMLKIAEEKNITKAAEKLYITQSALNQQLLKLEKELGAPIFNRSRTNWGPTEIGSIYLEAAKEIMHIKKQTYAQISDYIEKRKSTLSVAFTPGRGIDMFIHVYPAFHKLFPDITVEPHELSVRQQQQMLKSGTIDLAFGTMLENQRTDDEYILLKKEEIYIIVPESLPIRELPVPKGGRFPTLDLKQLEKFPFVMIYKESTMRKVLDDEMKKYGLHPEILFETRMFTAIQDLVRAGECCSFLAGHYVRDGVPEGMKIYSFPEPVIWDVTVSYKKRSYLSKASSTFIKLVKEYWE